MLITDASAPTADGTLHREQIAQFMEIQLLKHKFEAKFGLVLRGFEITEIFGRYGPAAEVALALHGDEEHLMRFTSMSDTRVGSLTGELEETLYVAKQV